MGHSTVYGSVLNYIALRLLGEGPEDDAVARGRKWILDHGGAIGTPLWGKLWLAVRQQRKSNLAFIHIFVETINYVDPIVLD